MQDFFDGAGFIGMEHFTYMEIFWRLMIAAALGCLIGLDREMKNKPIDFRAYMIICVATCLLAILWQEIMSGFGEQDAAMASTNFGKLVDGVLSGVGFLGAGAIIKHYDGQKDQKVIGTATGASIWASAILGLLVGFGYITMALMGFGVIFGILFARGLLRKPLTGQEDKEKV